MRRGFVAWGAHEERTLKHNVCAGERQGGDRDGDPCATLERIRVDLLRGVGCSPGLLWRILAGWNCGSVSTDRV